MQISDTVLAKALPIKLAIFDVDGVLTDGRLYDDDEHDFAVSFYIHDGLGLKLLQQAGIVVAIITGRNSPAVAKRMQRLNIADVYLGCNNKFEAYNALKTKYHLDDEQIAYAGDDWVDIPAMRHAGLKIAVPNAVTEIKELADWETSRCGGLGAARDICDLLLKAQGHFDKLLASFYQ